MSPAANEPILPRSAAALRIGAPFTATMMSPLLKPATSAGESETTLAITAPVALSTPKASARSGVRFWMRTPITPRRISPWAMSWLINDSAILMGIAKSDSDVPTAGPDDGGVDAHKLAGEIDECAARVAGVDRGVGLDEVFVALDAQARPSLGADDARSDGILKAEGIANSDDIITDSKGIGTPLGRAIKPSAGIWITATSDSGSLPMRLASG